jgi:DNA-binding MarR family transcriptional regulator
VVIDQGPEPVDRRIATGLYKLGLAMKQQSWVLANDEGLSPTQGQILSVLSLEGPLSGSELSARLRVTLPTISDSTRVLADKALVVKSPDPRHPRATLITLTEAGGRIAARVRSWPDFLASAAGALSEAEQEAFLLSLIKMLRELQHNGQIPTNRMCVTCTHFRPNVYDGATPHHCAFVDAPIANRELRIDCAEHAETDPETRHDTWRRFLGAD